MRLHSRQPKGPKTHEQFHQEQARKDETSTLQGLADIWDPLIIFNPAVTVDQGDEDVGEQAGDIEGNQGQDEIVLLLRHEQVLALSLALAVCGGLCIGLASLTGIVPAREERLLIVILRLHSVRDLVSLCVCLLICLRTGCKADKSLMPRVEMTAQVQDEDEAALVKSCRVLER